MKNNYKILDKNPKVSDRELESFMDFDALLEKNASRNNLKSNKPQRSNRKKYGLLGGAVAILMLGGWLLWPSESSILTTAEVSETTINTTKENATSEKISEEQTAEINTEEGHAQNINTTQDNELTQKAQQTQQTPKTPEAKVVTKTGVERAPSINTPIDNPQSNKVEHSTATKNAVVSPTPKSGGESSTKTAIKNALSTKAKSKNSIKAIPQTEPNEATQKKSVNVPEQPNLKPEEKPNTIDIENGKSENDFEVRTSLDKGAHVFVDAEPQGGTTGLYAYIDEKLQYPEAVEDKTKIGEVLLSFTIDKIGRPINIKVEESMGEHFDQEAIRVIRGMPQWIPATLNGAPTESKMSLSLSFNPKN